MSDSVWLAAVFKNESHILNEWIQHYRSFGVQRFILIDNGSTDKPLKKLDPHIKNGIVKYIYDQSLHDQIGKYNKHVLPLIRHIKGWIIVVDLDEFMYPRTNDEEQVHATPKSFARTLESLPQNVGQVSVPWKLFGSSGFVKQPSSVVRSFLMREHYTNLKLVNIKSIVRCSALIAFGIHEHEMSPGFLHIDSADRKMDTDIRPTTVPLITIDEAILQRGRMHLNHYAIQSLEWFQKVKMTRGSANCRQHDAVRNLKYFNQYDMNEIEDHELKDM